MAAHNTTHNGKPAIAFQPIRPIVRRAFGLLFLLPMTFVMVIGFVDVCRKIVREFQPHDPAKYYPPLSDFVFLAPVLSIGAVLMGLFFWCVVFPKPIKVTNKTLYVPWPQPLGIKMQALDFNRVARLGYGRKRLYGKPKMYWGESLFVIALMTNENRVLHISASGYENGESLVKIISERTGLAPEDLQENIAKSKPFG